MLMYIYYQKRNILDIEWAKLSSRNRLNWEDKPKMLLIFFKFTQAGVFMHGCHLKSISYCLHEIGRWLGNN